MNLMPKKSKSTKAIIIGLAIFSLIQIIQCISITSNIPYAESTGKIEFTGTNISDILTSVNNAKIDKDAYLIYKDGNTINAENKSTGKIEFTGKNISDILTSVSKAIIDGGTILIKEGVYTPSSPITFTKSINFIGTGNTIFNWNTKGYPLFEFDGLRLRTTGLEANVVSGTNIVSVQNIGTAKVGDLVLIYDNTIWTTKWYPTWKTGELHEISSITGTSITMSDTTIHSYSTSNGGNALLIRPTSVEINGITVIGGSSTDDYRAIQLRYNKNSIVRNNKLQNNGLEAVSARDSFRTTIDHNNIGGSAMNGYGYGVAVEDSSAYTTISNNYIDNSRHVIANGGNEKVGQPRETTVIRNIIDDSMATVPSDCVVDAHRITESLYIYNNTIYSPAGRNAIGSGAKITKVVGNIMYGGDGVAQTGTANYTFEITGNNFIDSRHIWSAAYDIHDIAPLSLIISGNLKNGVPHTCNSNIRC